MRLINSESMKMMGNFEENLKQRIIELQKWDEEKSQKATKRIQMLRANVMGTVGAIRMRSSLKSKTKDLKESQRDSLRSSGHFGSGKRPSGRPHR